MEKTTHLALASSRSESLLSKYRQLTSPIVSLHTLKRQDGLKDELKNNITTKLENIKGHGSKLYALDTSLSFAQLKASTVLYQIPEFSTPAVNYEVADHIKLKVEQMKNEIIMHLPEISKSSNYAPKKIEHQLNHRSAVRELEEWLRQKLKNPPQNYEESVEYKNMIMGIGMKELIRIIGKRCGEEGRMAEQIWELTWHICRQIIVYLSKRAKKCEDLLEEELQFMRESYEKEFRRLKQQNSNITTRISSLIAQKKELESELTKLKKRKQTVEEDNKALAFDNHHTRQQFRKVLEENLAIYLQIGNKSKRDWIKKMYKSIVTVSDQPDSIFRGQMKQQIAGVMQDRIRQQEITEDCGDKIGTEDFKTIEKEVERNVKRQQKTKNKIKSYHATKNEINVQATMVTELQTIPPQQSVDHTDDEDDDSDLSSCDDIVKNLREEFKPVDAATSTPHKMLTDAFASTVTVKFSDLQTQVDTHCLNMLEEIGVNTQQVKDYSNETLDELKNAKDEQKNSKKKMNKQNSKQDSRTKSKQKKISTTAVRDKYRGKSDNKKLPLDIVHEEFQHTPERKSEMYEDLASNETNPASEISNISFTNTSPPVSLILNSSAEQQQSSKIKGSPIQKSSQPATNIRNVTLIQHHSSANIQQNDLPRIEKGRDDNGQLDESAKDNSYLSAIQAKFLQKFASQQNSSQYGSIRSKSLAEEGKGLQQIPQQSTRIQAEGQFLMYICADCHKIIMNDEHKYANSKISSKKTSKYQQNTKMFNTQQKKYDNSFNPVDKTPLTLDPINNENYEETGQRKSLDYQGRKVRRHMTLKTTTYNHDISFKKDLEDQQIRKTNHLSNFNNQYPQTVTECSEIEPNTNAVKKTTLFKLLYSKMMDSNKDHISLIVNGQQQVTENLDNYFQLVKQISSIPEHKIMMTEKAILTTIEKNIFPIINELLVVVRKAVKYNHINETIKMFTSLPNIIYNRMSRKYGVKILAIKNLKLLLMALKAAARYTQKYKVIELMMFTDCKSPNSEDLFMYLLIMGLMDPTFSYNKLLTHEELLTIRTLCEEHLTKERTVYADFGNVDNQTSMKTKSNIALMDIVKSVITNYRLLKINRIEELGFIFVMLKKDHWMQFKTFVYFLSCLPIKNSLKVGITKKLLQYCDIRNKDQRIGITENMFTKFLMDCDLFSFQLLGSAVKKQTQNYHESNREAMVEVVSRLFVTKTNAVDQLDDSQVNQRQQHLYNKYKANCITQASEQAIRQQKSVSIDLHRRHEQKNESTSKSVVLKQLKEYSWFTEQICGYLQGLQQVKYLSERQLSFIKEYLIVHTIENEVEQVMGIADYLSNSMLEIFAMPAASLSIYHRPHPNK